MEAPAVGELTACEQSFPDTSFVMQHTYVYGPLLNGATLVLWEGVPTFPEPDRIWQIVEKHKAALLILLLIHHSIPSSFKRVLQFRQTWLLKMQKYSCDCLQNVDHEAIHVLHCR